LSRLSGRDDYGKHQRSDRHAQAVNQKHRRWLKTLADLDNDDFAKPSDLFNRQISKLQSTCGFYPSAQS